MDDVKSKLKGLMKKLNKPPSGFKGEGHVLGSASDSVTAAAPRPNHNSHSNGKTVGIRGDPRRPIHGISQSNDPPSSDGTVSSKAPQVAEVETETGNLLLSSDPLSLPGMGASEVGFKMETANIPPSGSVPNDSQSCDTCSSEGMGMIPSRFVAEATVELEKHPSKSQSFDPFAPAIGASKPSKPSEMPTRFQCPVCLLWWNSEAEVASHLDGCLQQTLPSGSPSNNADSALSAFLAGSPSEDSIGVLTRLLRNILNQPTSDKFRSIRMGNPKIQETIGKASGAPEVLEAVGFILKTEGEEIYAVMELPSENQIDILKKVVSTLEPCLQQQPPVSGTLSGQENRTAVVPRKTDRQIRVFHASPENLAARIELPDSFFALSSVEVKQEAAARRKKLEDSQLLIPKSFREKQLEAAKRKYKASIIRVQFPDGIILQGVFLPTEPISHLYEFVSDALSDSALQFELVFHGLLKNQTAVLTISAGKKNVTTLEAAELVPSALVKFKPIDVEIKPVTWLRPELLSQSEPLTSLVLPLQAGG